MELQEIIQKSDAWHQVRKGKFTGSEIWKLMVESRSKSEALSETTKTYILEKIAEAHSNELVTKFETQAMQWGNEYEPLAKKWYAKQSGNSVKDIGFITLEGFDDYVGGSPDGLIDYQGIIEIKCPFNSSNHIRHILATKDDFKSELKEYYWQMQFYMACLNVEWCDFVSFDPRIDADWGLHIKRITRNNDDIQLMKNKIEQAIEYRNRIEAEL